MLIIILVIVLLILFIQYGIKRSGFQISEISERSERFQEGFQEGMKPRDNPTKKGLICYYGGAFRYGQNGNSNQDSERGYDSQFYATQSHMKLTEIIIRIHSKEFSKNNKLNYFSSWQWSGQLSKYLKSLDFRW